jgi:hypothetical protein
MSLQDPSDDSDIEVTRVVLPNNILQKSKIFADTILTDCNSSTDSECGSKVNQFVTLPANKNYEKPKNVVDTILLDSSENDFDNLLVDSSSSNESEHRCDNYELNTLSGKEITPMTKVVVSGIQDRGEFIVISVCSRFILL